MKFICNMQYFRRLFLFHVVMSQIVSLRAKAGFSKNFSDKYGNSSTAKSLVKYRVLSGVTLILISIYNESVLLQGLISVSVLFQFP